MVIEPEKEFGLLERDLLKSDILLTEVNSELLPTIRGVLAHMEISDGAKSMFCGARPVTLALEKEINRELDRLECMGMISKCQGVVDASTVVWVGKSSKGLRLCVDFKVHVNGKTKHDSHPMPNSETISAK